MARSIQGATREIIEPDSIYTDLGVINKLLGWSVNMTPLPVCTVHAAVLGAVASTKEAQSIGMAPTSVAGGNCAEGNWLPIASLCGPGSLRFPGALALIAPCGGRSGLPKEAACAALAVITAPAADTASISRLQNLLPLLSEIGCGYVRDRFTIIVNH